MMRIDVITLFPRIFDGPLSESMLRVAQAKGLVDIRVVDLRAFTDGRHRVADDYPFGGGGGMVLKPEPVFRAVEAIRRPDSRVILLCPQGVRLTQAIAARLARERHLILVCGHYEGIDDRIRSHLVDEELSIGDYVLTGGELPALVVTDAVVRLLPGVLGAGTSVTCESFVAGRLDYPQYTRPAQFRGLGVPKVLLSGDHRRIDQWRRGEAVRRTVARRPDLLATAPLTAEEQTWLDQARDGDSTNGAPAERGSGRGEEQG
jgi:tRNA (guanine37-N1)-methyltransferase